MGQQSPEDSQSESTHSRVTGCEEQGLLHTWKAADTWIDSTLDLSWQETKAKSLHGHHLLQHCPSVGQACWCWKRKNTHLRNTANQGWTFRAFCSSNLESDPALTREVIATEQAGCPASLSEWMKRKTSLLSFFLLN